MKSLPTILAIGLLFLLLPSCGQRQFEGDTYKPMQEDFDRIRLDHLFVIAKLLQEYESKAGHFPFANSAEIPVAVVIASEDQLKNDDGRAPIMLDLETRANEAGLPAKPERIEMRTVTELTEELEAVLEREIKLPVDPQKVPVNKPSVYVFTSYRGVFDVSAFLHNSFPFARELSEFNNKVAISNRSNHRSGVWVREELMQQAEFRGFFGAAFNRSGYTLQTAMPQD